MNNEEIKTTNQSLKIQLSLASLMFFSPFISHLLKDDSFELDNKDRAFVEGYLSLGLINIGLLGLALLTGLLSYFYNIPVLTTMYQIIVGILVVLLSGECIGAITETKILHSATDNRIIEYTNSEKIRIFLSYLPGYSIYLRYTKHDFDSPDLLLKESLVVWIIIGGMSFIASPFFILFGVIAILVRIVSLLGNINIIPLSISEFFSSLFYKNPEELWGYIWGSIVFIFHRNYNRPYWKFLVENTKKEYQYLYDIKQFGSIQRQYGLLFISIVFILWQVDLGHIPGLSIIAVLLVLLRYGIMLFVWGRSPSLPLMRELVAFGSTIIKPFTLKK